MNNVIPYGPHDKPAKADGDSGFAGVIDRMHPAQLQPGAVAALENGTLEFGDIRHRWAAVMEVWGHRINMGGAPLACARWFEPDTGEEALVVLTAGARADGGVGRAWRLTPGNVPEEISLNGSDVWTTCRLVSARSGLVLTRFGNARHYFNDAAVNLATDQVTLNSAAEVVSGDKVTLYQQAQVAPPLPLLPNTSYWVKIIGANVIEFYTDSGLGAKINLTSKLAGGWYIEKVSQTPGVGGNGALPLLLQPAYSMVDGTTVTAWKNGFHFVPQAVAATIANGTSLWLAQNHRFAAGQAVKVGQAVGTSFNPAQIYYAEPVNAHQLYLHLSATTALIADAASRLAANANSAANTLYPNSYSGQPIVPLTEAIYFKNRLVGLNGRNNVAVSDPGDLLHFTPFTGALTAALGNGDPLTTILALGDNTSGIGGNSLLLASGTQVLGITGLNSPDQSTWELVQVTQEYGSLAPLAAIQVGKDGWLFSRAGVMVVEQTTYGRLQANPLPVSRDILRKFAEIDWANATQACAAHFSNRFILAVPLKNQAAPVQNNCLFVYNQLTQAWDHFWTGDALRPVQFAKFTIGGEERLAFLNANGDVMYFDPDGHADITCDSADGNTFTYTATDIVMRAWLRGYTNGSPRLKNFQLCEVVVDTLNACWSLTAIREDVNNVAVYRQDITGDPKKFVVHGVQDYAGVTEAARAQLPGRQDYSVVTDGDGNMDLNALGKVFEAHQSFPDSIPLTERSRSLQFLFENKRGSARLRSVYVEAVPEVN